MRGFRRRSGARRLGAARRPSHDDGPARRQDAYYIDKILRGVKPADLPVEEPTNFRMVLKRKTAKALNISIPQSVLLRADQLIE